MKRIFLALSIFLLSFNVTLASDCPFGLVNDPAPGDCSLYIDKDGNNLCDYSETGEEGEAISEEELKAMTVSEVAAFFEISASTFASELSKFLNLEVKISDNMQTLHDESGLCTTVAAGIAQSLKTGNKIDLENLAAHEAISGQELKTMNVSAVAKVYAIDTDQFKAALSEYLGTNVYAGDSFQSLHDMYDLSPSDVKDIATNLQNNANLNQANTNIVNSTNTVTKREPTYRFIEILIIILVLYLISHLSVKAKYLTLLSHRRIWNMILLVSFLISAIFGVILILAINYGWFLSIYAFILYWHVEFGSVMAIVTIFHIAWHWPYYKAIFKKKPKLPEAEKIAKD